MSDLKSDPEAAPALTPAALRAAFADARAVDVPREEGVPESFKPAAVLVPVVVRDEGLTMLLTRRTDHLHDHPGQISFPGGRALFTRIGSRLFSLTGSLGIA